MENFKEKYKNIIFKNKNLFIIADNYGFKSEDEFLDNIANILSNNKCILSFVNKGLTDRKFIELSQKIKILCNEFNSLFLINSRPDIAYITGSNGILLNTDNISVNDAKEILPENSLIGIFTGNISPNDINNENIDFIVSENETENDIINTDKPIFIKIKHEINNIENFKTFMLKS